MISLLQRHLNAKVFTTLVLGCFVLSYPLLAQTAQHWLTKGDKSKLLSQEQPVVFEPHTPLGNIITVDPAQTFQEMDGFGAAMTGSSAYLLNNVMTSAQQEATMNDLFTPAGINIRFLRHTIGASDFSLSSYTYADTPDDNDLSEFSIAGDEANIIPMLQMANTKTEGNLKLLGSPWSAPAWMKLNNELNGGQLSSFRQGIYADYLVKYVQAYEAKGLPVYAMTVQNEPLHDDSRYPSMFMHQNQMIDFVKNDLGPAFDNAGLSTKIICFDHNYNDFHYPIEVLDDAGANQYLAGSAFHGYDGTYENRQIHVHDAHPDKGIWFTEQAGHGWGKIWGAYDYGGDLTWETQNLFIGPIRNYAKGVLFWNLALDRAYGPQNNGCDNCHGVITIDQNTGEVVKEVQYYVLAHFSKFVDPGAMRIASNEPQNNLKTVAFQNPDQSIVLVVLASWGFNGSFQVKYEDKSFSMSMNDKSVATFKWYPEGVTSSSEHLEAVPNAIYLDNEANTLTVEASRITPVSGMQVVDIQGKLIYEYPDEIISTQTLDLPTLKRGIYLVKYYNGILVRTTKIFKK